MADSSGISWTGGTWNPIRARAMGTGRLGFWCSRVNEACRNCYAERRERWVGAQVPYRAQDRDRVDLDDDPEISKFQHRDWEGDRWGEPYWPIWCDERGADTVSRVGAKRSGRLLDGVTHDAVPAIGGRS